MEKMVSAETDMVREADEHTLRLMADGLVLLTAGLSAAGIDISGGLLGGEFGYGGDFENDVFMMHQFCWCDRDDCPWCASCSCPEEAWSYYIDDTKCTFDEFMQFFEENAGHAPAEASGWEEWEAKADAVNARRRQVHSPMCHWCTHPEDVKPNFLHKASGTRVTWYKYIGRSMEAQISGVWDEILADCLESLSVPVTERVAGVEALGAPDALGR